MCCDTGDNGGAVGERGKGGVGVGATWGVGVGVGRLTPARDTSCCLSFCIRNMKQTSRDRF